MLPAGSNFISAVDLYGEDVLRNLLLTRTPTDEIYWSILPPTAGLPKTYSIISWTQQKPGEGILRIGIREMVALFDCTKDMKNDYPEWIRLSFTSDTKARKNNDPKDFRHKFDKALRGVRKGGNKDATITDASDTSSGQQTLSVRGYLFTD
jgi:hypothetical protein